MPSQITHLQRTSQKTSKPSIYNLKHVRVVQMLFVQSSLSENLWSASIHFVSCFMFHIPWSYIREYPHTHTTHTHTHTHIYSCSYQHVGTRHSSSHKINNNLRRKLTTAALLQLFNITKCSMNLVNSTPSAETDMKNIYINTITISCLCLVFYVSHKQQK